MKVCLISILFLVGCAGTPPLSEVEPDSGVPINKAAACASEFGNALTASFGRLDGTVVAVVAPSDAQCAMPNNDHVVVQIRANGAVYRIVVNIRSDYGDPDIRFAQTHAALLGGAWSEGWHPGMSVDYSEDLGLHSNQGFEPVAMEALANRVVDAIPLGVPISAYASSSGGSYAHSAHKVHRNRNHQDGALVLEPDSASPRWLVFHFANQSF